MEEEKVRGLGDKWICLLGAIVVVEWVEVKLCCLMVSRLSY